MTTYYVRKDGNDTTGDGSTETPWLTLSKALGTISAGGGHIVKVGDGTYAENTAGITYLYINNKNYTAEVVIEAELGQNGDVVVSGTGTTFATRISGSSNIRFNYLKFISQADTVGRALELRNSTISNIYFYCCTFTIYSKVDSVKIAVYGFPGAAATFENIIFDTCIFNQIGVYKASGIYLKRDAEDDSVDVVTIKNCIFNMVGNGISLTGVTNMLVQNNQINVSSGETVSIQIGEDGATGYTTTGVVENNYINTLAGHGLLLGAGASGVIAQSNTIYGGDYALVFKECVDCIAQRNTIFGGSNASVYFKASSGNVVRNNKITNSIGAYCVQVLYNPESLNKAINNNLTYNAIYAHGDTKVFNWGDITTHDGGGNICDYNTYKIGANKFGDVLETSDIQTLAELRAAWATYDVTTNDSHSKLYNDGSFLLLMRRRRR